MDKLSVARDRLRILKSDMAIYESKAETIARLRRQRNEAIKIALAALAQPAPDGVNHRPDCEHPRSPVKLCDCPLFLTSVPDDVIWSNMANCPRDGKQTAVQDYKGKLHIVYANPELDRSNFVCWSRPDQGEV